jgi:hypothetical protein
MSVSYTIAQGDTEPPLDDILTDQDDNPVDLTLATAVSIKYRLRPGGTPVTKSATVQGDPLLGQVRRTWDVGDTNVIGIYDYTWIVDFSGREQTFPSNNYEQFEIYGDLV